jgi:hypothetical protein
VGYGLAGNLDRHDHGGSRRRHLAFEQITFTFDLPQEGVIALDGTKRYAEFAPNDFRRVKIEGTKSFRDQTDYAAFKAYEARRLRMTALNVNSLLTLGNPASADQTASWDTSACGCTSRR